MRGNVLLMVIVRSSTLAIMDEQTHKADGNALPYRVNAELLYEATVALRQHPANPHEGLAAVTGSRHGYVEAALIVLGLAHGESLALTDLGRELAYTTEDSLHEAFLRVLHAHAAFATTLTYLFSRANSSTLVDEVAAHWGRRKVGLSDKNRQEGALVFAHLVAAAKLGRLVLGRGSNRTRIVWENDATSKWREHASKADDESAHRPDAGSPQVPNSAAEAAAKAPPSSRSDRPDVGEQFETFSLYAGRGEVARLAVRSDVDEADVERVSTQVEALLQLFRARAAARRPDDGAP